MSPETYQQLARELGIDRGQIDSGFRTEDAYSVSATKPRAILPPGTIAPPKIDEEPEGQYVHLNTPAWRTLQITGRRGGRAKKK